MEAILIFFGVVIGLAYAVSPIVALFIAIGARRKAGELEKIIAVLKQELTRLRSASMPPKPAAEPTPSMPVAARPPVPATPSEPAIELPEAPPATPVLPAEIPNLASASISSQDKSETVIPPPPPKPAPVEAAPSQLSVFISGVFLKAKDWLFTGNLVAKVGLLILFIGVSFLLKYAAARVSLPIEFRLAGVTLADIALLVWGWRIREQRPGIGLSVQGAALAILMLVTFGAFKMYHLIPGGLAFVLLFVLTAFTCVLAVLQNALWLAVFGIAGGFAAPIMTSTGQGSHIALFSYYAVLNAGILAIALRRSWRLLNLLGFVFTFLIGTTWGVLKYVPENYLSAQLFLILFFLFYVAIALVYAARQAPQLKHYVDATLVFGTPLLAFGLQFGLVKEVHFGLAFSALALGLFYIGAALLLWQKRGGSLRLLVESFLALGIVFGTLAIPFALDGRWTSAAWALEGAGIVWVGLRQRRTQAWLFGLLVQAGAWLSFLFSVGGLDPVAAAQSNLWLGFLLLAATAFLMATNFRAQAGQDGGARFGPIATVFLALAALWFVAGAWTEIWLRFNGALLAILLVLTALLAAGALGFIAQRMQWQIARYFALVVQVVAALVLLLLALVQLDWPFRDFSTNLFDGPFLGALMIGAGAFFSSWVFYRQSEHSALPRLRSLSKGLLLWSGFWWHGLVLFALSGWVVAHYLIFTHGDMMRQQDLWLPIYGIGLALSGPLFALGARRLQWGDLRYSAVPNWLALAFASILMLGDLYGERLLPSRENWAGYLALWLAAEWLLRFWQNNYGAFHATWIRLLHLLRTVGPWLMIWPLGYQWISLWLHGGTQQEQQLLDAAGWFSSGSWARYLPAWAMMAALGWLMQRCRADGWPVTPLAAWYRRVLIPLGAGWAILLVLIWNLTQNGSMAPLPYLPLLNPLDLSTCFAILLGVAAYRLAAVTDDGKVAAPIPAELLGKLALIAFIAAYGWFNLVLLRTVSHYMDIPYQFDLLFASQFVQAMLSLVWSATALILMRRAVKQVSRNQWLLGASLLALVVLKLFFVDLSNVGGVERIISFVGVGLLMVAIGYVAPYPAQPKEEKAGDTRSAR